MSNNDDDQQLKDLTAIWYKKLENSGFKDVEYSDAYLHSYCSYEVPRIREKDGNFDRAAYYISAEHFLNEHNFKNATEKFIWEQHSQNISIRNTVKKLKQRRIKVTQYFVYITLKRLKVDFRLYIRVQNYE